MTRKQLAEQVGLASKEWRYITVVQRRCTDGVTRSIQTWQHKKTKEFKHIRL